MAFEYRSKFGRSSFRSPRGRGVSSFRGRGRGSTSDSYHSSTSRDSYSSKPTFRGSSFHNSSYRDSRGSTNRFSGDRDRYISSHTSRRDDEPSFHRREIKESTSGSFGREHSTSGSFGREHSTSGSFSREHSTSGSFSREHSRRTDGESDRKRIRTDLGGSFKEGYSSRRSYDDYDHSNRNFNSSSSSPYRSNSSPYGAKPYKKDFIDFKKPLPPSDRSSYSIRRPMRGTRGRISTSIRPAISRVTKTPMPSLLRRNPVSRLKQPTSRLQLLLRKKKQLQIMRMRKEREIRQRPSSSGKPYAEDSSKNLKDVPSDFVDDDVDMEEIADDEGPPGVSRSPERKVPKREERDSSPEKVASQSESLNLKVRDSYVSGYRRIALKCPHCKFECKMFKSYQSHLTTSRHKAAMEELLFNLKQKLRQLRTEQREDQRRIDERDDNFNRTSYCKLCKLNYKQTRQEHTTSDYHVSMSEILNSKCRLCRMDFATPLLYEHHRCTLTHIKRKAFLERKGALNSSRREEENNDDENFMVLDSVGSADESNEEADTSKGETSDSPKKISLEAKKKTTIIGSEYIKKVSIYYCQLCKFSLNYNPNRDAEDALLTHCRTRFHLKRYSLETDKKRRSRKDGKTEGGTSQEKTAENATVETMDDGNDGNEQFWVDDEVTGDDHKSSEDEDDSHSGNRYDRFSTSDEKDTDKVKIEPGSDDETKRDHEKQPSAKGDS